MIIIEKDSIRYETDCKYCGCVDTKFGEGKGPHIAELICKGCNRHKGWLPAHHADIYKYALNKINEYKASREEGRKKGIAEWKAKNEAS